MCNVAREGLGEKSMRSFLASRLTVITLGSIYCSRRGLSQYLIGESQGVVTPICVILTAH